ncbi:NAD(P)/FAD-dependent oxidoreductase [Aliikangiella sp. G2MR2-5]|uniref:FAD-dependent oxidoreductase n=1 Tax=Aliikangiella sp. G2MR2-5 TaxID=2788943 RepID=UPI0018AC3B35|nr:NAD(P)/FAD-dependent oxidoreductase [Aliikangiella sp. G2MR2-5]
MRPSIAIIGGGIAGLAFAIHYKKLGGRVDIYERSPLSGREGLGFIMLENGMRALSKLSLDQEASKIGYSLDACHIIDNTNNLLTDEPLQGSYGVTRKAFIDLLLAQIPADWLHFDHQFSHFEWSDNNSASYACFSNGNKVSADFFLGCDGGRSAVRNQIFPNAKRSEVRVKELVSIVESEALVNSLGRRFIKFKQLEGGLAVGMVPADDKRVIWFVQYDCQRFDIENLSFEGKKAFAEKLVNHWPAPISSLIENTNFDLSHIWQTCYLLPLEKFHKNNVVLLGDAAHALLPFTSQGVNSAIEDAIELCRVFDKAQEGYTAIGLEHYSAMRRSIVNQYLDQGIALQEEFLQAHHAEQKIPFAF